MELVTERFWGSTDDSYASGGQLSCSVVHQKRRFFGMKTITQRKTKFFDGQLKAAIGAVGMG